MLRAAIACGALALCGVGVSHAQVPGPPGNSNKASKCVYDVLVERGEAMNTGRVFLAYTVSKNAEGLDQVNAVLGEAKVACEARYKLNAAKLTAAANLGIFRSVVDYLEQQLIGEGAPGDTLDRVRGALDNFSQDERFRFGKPDWREDADFHKRVDAALVAAGIPDKPEALAHCYKVIEMWVAQALEHSKFVYG